MNASPEHCLNKYLATLINPKIWPWKMAMRTYKMEKENVWLVSKACLLLCHTVYHFFICSSGRVMKIFPDQIYSYECDWEPHLEQRWYFPSLKDVFQQEVKKEKKVKTWLCLCVLVCVCLCVYVKICWTSWCQFLCPTDFQLCISGPDLFFPFHFLTA